MINKNQLRFLEVLFIVLLAAFSLWIMFLTFSYNYKTHQLLLSFKVWGDFGLTIPLIRSFSLGENWPPQYPLFPGEPIKYHFLFFYFVGLLEKMGAPIHWALNIPSGLGFFLILLMLYFLGKTLFNDKRVGVLAILFFIFNGSLGFHEFFKKHPVSLKSIFSTIDYSSAGPWDGSRVLALWNLGVFVNQRHFCVALAILMSLIGVCSYFEKLSEKLKTVAVVGLGFAIGTLPTLHEPVCLMVAITMIIYFLFLPHLRRFLFGVGAVSIFFMALIYALGGRVQPSLDNIVRWYPGFTVHDQLSIVNGILFWWYNMGLHIVLIPLGLIFAPKRVRIFLLPAFVIFAMAFTIAFSADPLTNHKFFNFFLIYAPMLSAFIILKFIDGLKNKKFPYRILGWSATGVVLFFLTVTGVIDLFGLKNSLVTSVPDIQGDPTASWIFKNTPPSAVFLNSSLFYHPASLAGRKIFEGPHYVTGGPGYPIYTRFDIMTKIYSSQNLEVICSLMQKNNLTYMTVQDTSKDIYMPKIPVEYFRLNFKADFSSPDGQILIYSFKNLCGNWGHGKENGPPPNTR